VVTLDVAVTVVVDNSINAIAASNTGEDGNSGGGRPGGGGKFLGGTSEIPVKAK
jgi:hypothetical protein